MLQHSFFSDDCSLNFKISGALFPERSTLSRQLRFVGHLSQRLKSTRKICMDFLCPSWENALCSDSLLHCCFKCWCDRAVTSALHVDAWHYLLGISPLSSWFALFCIFPFLLLVIFWLIQFHPDTELLVCPSVSVNTYKNNLLHNLGPWAGSCRLFSDLCLFLCACLWMFVCFRRKNRCSCSFRIGFLILATKRPVIYVIVLLPWPKQYWKRDEGGRGTDGRPLDRRKCWLLVHSLITVGKHYHSKCGIITISMLEWIILIISKFAIPK